MTIPTKVRESIISEAQKNARFSWYQGWERASGYIKSELRGESRYGTCRIYIKWGKKKEPTNEQVHAEIVKCVDRYLNNEEHHQHQRDFTHHVLDNYYVDISQAKHEVMLHLEDALPVLIAALEKSEDFCEPKIQSIHNELKNFECTLSDYEGIKQFLDQGRKRVGEG